MPSPRTLVYPNGFEPSTHSVGGYCSIQLSYGYMLGFYIITPFFKICKKYFIFFESYVIIFLKKIGKKVLSWRKKRLSSV